MFFTGLSAFPLTPFHDAGIDEDGFVALVRRLATRGVDSITALGSTGSYAYLTREERRRIAELAVRNAGEVPVVVGIGALRTSHVLERLEDAQTAGVAGVLLAPVTYQALTDEDVFGLFEDVAAASSLPVVLYDNPGTTHVTFTDELYAAIAALPRIASIKIPGVPVDPEAARARIAHLRTILPDDVTIGVSGDAFGAAGLGAGCDAWYSVIAGTVPEPALAILRAARAGDTADATLRSERLQPLWDLFARYGSLRVTAAIAEHLGLVTRSCLPLPIRGLDDAARRDVASVVGTLGLAA
ncbi:dihydrodipicolinate synthase family protein [Pseudoclavibacter chungangensis]|uniref:Dihydrodipicolinate synthase family protein n=1 Tax=Pseudoclavibacter chungangensis TaxID=587635 RepID=A0A7J5BPX5_9MICO|nr:dihydrodipicolinate synthase family protein [Pseudoclavibacter chungangensis]KAB1655370.1 dihydrodipicolinate synthase family protein [Pseudoclavibacter chungangensis]NYJ68320.1 4-hydroxy-tetrahydrodipicolinate synthase [Pseudoclavibacter chungangensis]